MRQPSQALIKRKSAEYRAGGIRDAFQERQRFYSLPAAIVCNTRGFNAYLHAYLGGWFAAKKQRQGGEQ